MQSAFGSVFDVILGASCVTQRSPGPEDGISCRVGRGSPDAARSSLLLSFACFAFLLTDPNRDSVAIQDTRWPLTSPDSAAPLGCATSMIPPFFFFRASLQTQLHDQEQVCTDVRLTWSSAANPQESSSRLATMSTPTSRRRPQARRTSTPASSTCPTSSASGSTAS